MFHKTVAAACLAVGGLTALGGAASGSHAPAGEPTVEPHSHEHHSDQGRPEPRPIDLQFTHVCEPDGLLHPTVSSIAQDSDGFMWFGTPLGLSRFDGYEFEHFSHDPRVRDSLAADNVRDIFEDRDGRLWIAVDSLPGGISRYDPRTESMVTYSPDRDDPSAIPAAITKSITQDADGTIWIGSDGGLSRYNPGTDDFTSWAHDPDDPDSLPETSILAVLADADSGDLLLGTRNSGLLVFDPITKQHATFRSDARDVTTISSDRVNHLYRDPQGRTWVSTSKGLNRFDLDTGGFERFTHDDGSATSLSDDNVNQTLVDGRERFWVATATSLELFDPDTGEFERVLHDPETKRSIAGDGVSAIHEDRSGAVWFGVIDEGLSRLAGEPPKFKYFVPSDSGQGGGISHEKVTALHVDDSDVAWIGYDDGLDRYDGTTSTHFTSAHGDPTTLTSSEITAIAPDPLGDGLWVGTASGLNRFDTASGTFTRYAHDPDDPNSIVDAPIRTIAADHQGAVWIGHDLGMSRLDDGRFTHYAAGDSAYVNPDEFIVEPDRYIPRNPTSITPSPIDDTLWVQSSRGIVEVDPAEETFRYVTFGTGDSGFGSGSVARHHINDDGTVWLYRTKGAIGLVLVDMATREVLFEATTDFPSLRTSSMIVDRDGLVWIGGVDFGLTSYDPSTGEINQYDETDGLGSNEIGNNALAQTSDGLMYVGGTNGLNTFTPGAMPINTTPPRVVLTGFELFNEPAEVGVEGSPLRAPLRATQRLTLEHQQAMFSITFAALNYSQPSNNEYAYMLEGFDDDWLFTTAERRTATYTNLDPGTYTFRVIASNNDGVWNQTGAMLAIEIEPPWWQTSWAYMAFTGLALVGIAGFVRWRTWRIKRRNLALREANRRIEGIVDAVPAGLAILDLDYRVLFCNPIASSSNFAGVGLTVGKRVERIGDQRIEELLDPPPRGFWHECQLTDGAVDRSFAVIARPLETVGERDRRWLLAVLDLTFEREVQARAATQQRLASVGTFAAGIAHDFNNMLTVISLSAELAKSSGDIAPSVRTQVERIERQASDASSLVEQLLAFSRQRELERSVLDLGETVRAHSSFLDQILSDTHRLNVTVEPGSHIVDADPTQVRQAVTNLVTNARDAMPDGGTIDVRVASQRGAVRCNSSEHPLDRVVVAVRDEGPGIAAEIRDRLFEPFVTTKAVGKGTGLGLSQVVGIMSQHDGSVDVHSEPGDGATFTLSFPRVSACTPPPEIDTRRPTSRRLEGERVMLVEDDDDLREALGEGLERLGYAVTHASNGAQALERWSHEPSSFDLIVSDVTMPVMGGVELYRATSDAGRTAPFVFITGVPADDSASSGVDDLVREESVLLLRKPVRIEDLDVTLQQMLVHSSG